ncbi:hypothetical protein NQZ68_025948, partial [Dissostichus eleginoides]
WHTEQREQAQQHGPTGRRLGGVNSSPYVGPSALLYRSEYAGVKDLSQRERSRGGGLELKLTLV